MGLVIDLLHALHADVGIDLRGGKAGVAEERLYGAKIRAIVQQVSGKTVAQFMWCDIQRDI